MESRPCLESVHSGRVCISFPEFVQRDPTRKLGTETDPLALGSDTIRAVHRTRRDGES